LNCCLRTSLAGARASTAARLRLPRLTSLRFKSNAPGVRPPSSSPPAKTPQPPFDPQEWDEEPLGDGYPWDLRPSAEEEEEGDSRHMDAPWWYDDYWKQREGGDIAAIPGGLSDPLRESRTQSVIAEAKQNKPSLTPPTADSSASRRLDLERHVDHLGLGAVSLPREMVARVAEVLRGAPALLRMVD